MISRFYEIISSEKDGNYLFEKVESGGQLGVRCRIYITKDELFPDILYKYDNTKWGYHFRKFLSKRYPQEIAYKFEAFTWCLPFDKFDFELGKEMSKKKVNEKIATKKRKIQKFIHNLEKNNLPIKLKLGK